MSAYIWDVTGEVTVCKQSFIVNSVVVAFLHFHELLAMTVMPLSFSQEVKLVVVKY